MRSIHDRASAGDAHGGPAADLWRGLMKHAGMPEPPPMQQQSATIATEMLRRLGSAEAKEALTLLAQSADEHVASRAREALERFDQAS